MATLYGAGGVAGTFDSILKDFYIGPVQEQLNNEVFALEMFEKAVVDWNGKNCIIPVHTVRNTGVDFMGDGASLKDAAAQTYASLTVKAKFLYGQFSVTGPAISAAKKGSSNSFISYVDAEMTTLVNDVRDTANKAAVSGGRVKGFICTRGVTFADTASAVSDGANTGGGQDCLFDGDFSVFADCVTGAANDATWIEVDLINTATGLTVGATDDVFYVTDGGSTAAHGEVAGKLEISRGNSAGGTAAALNLGTAVADPHCVAVVLKDTLTIANTGKVLTASSKVGAVAGDSAGSDQITGIYGNLADPSHFGVTRTNASNTALMSTVQTVNTAADAAARADLTVKRMQQMFDECLANSGDEPDAILMHPLQRSIYVGLLGGNLRANVGDTLKGSAGFTGLEFNGVPIHTSRHVSNGMVIFLSKASWKLCELEPGGFADLDGNVLSRSAEKDQYNGYYRWYWNLVCTKPGANAILVGSNLS